MLSGLNEKVIAITGGARGIGAAIASACAAEGSHLILIDRNQAALTATAADLRRPSSEIIPVVVDLTDSLACTQALQAAATRLGRLDGLVNNAGINDGVGLETGDPARFLASLEKNLVHYFTLTQAAHPFLRQTRGSIVNISSKVAVTGQGGTSGYAAAKGAVLELTRHWAQAFAADGIRVNAIVPSEVMTPQYREWLSTRENPDQDLRQIASRIPLQHRFTRPEEIASAVVFLLSSSCALNAQEVFIDGGYVHLDRSLA